MHTIDLSWHCDFVSRRSATRNAPVTGPPQGVQGHAYRIRQSSAAEQSQMLITDFQSIIAGLHAGSYQSQEVVKQDIQEICRSAAESFSSQDQVTFATNPLTDVEPVLRDCLPSSISV